MCRTACWAWSIAPGSPGRREFQAHITVLTCSCCQTACESEELRALVAPNSKFTFDVMVDVAQALFLHCRNTKEIQRELGDKNINISLRDIDHLGRRFIVYLALAHEQSQEQLKAFMGSQGGYILHLDGTKMLLAVFFTIKVSN